MLGCSPYVEHRNFDWAAISAGVRGDLAWPSAEDCERRFQQLQPEAFVPRRFTVPTLELAQVMTRLHTFVTETLKYPPVQEEMQRQLRLLDGTVPQTLNPSQ